jgi:hypothetical protein
MAVGPEDEAASALRARVANLQHLVAELLEKNQRLRQALATDQDLPSGQTRFAPFVAVYAQSPEILGKQSPEILGKQSPEILGKG